MLYSANDVGYAEVAEPAPVGELHPVDLTDGTMAARRERVLAAMDGLGLDVLAVYADREHGDNYEYLTGYSPRFEEAVLVLHADGRAFNMVGNESLGMNGHARIEATAVHAPYFSLPNQPMHDAPALSGLFSRAGIASGHTVGIVGWKLLRCAGAETMFDVPGFIVEAVRTAAGDTGKVVNATGLFIDEVLGVRLVNNANEIAHYEFGAALASRCVLTTMDRFEPGKTEMDLAQTMAAAGQQQTVQTICAGGERFGNAVVAPRDRPVGLGETFSLTMGYQGGLTNRTGYIARDVDDLPAGAEGYIGAVVKPYYAAAATWYTTVGVGVLAAEVFDAIEQVIPAERYGWVLNPGHYTASEEWLASPFYEDSEVVLKSGMMLQMDIIVKVPGFGGANAEDGIALADEALRRELAERYPETWSRIERRRAFMRDACGIDLPADVLPLSDTEGYQRPLILNHDKAMRIGA